MPLIEYVPHKFYGAQRQLVDAANKVIAEWQRQGYRLTLRQLYYRLVSTNFIANTVKEYKRLGHLIVLARRAGEVDWDALEDRTRNLRALRNFDNPSDAMKWLADQYHTDMWSNQMYRVEVWFEKDALAGIFNRACNELDVPYFSSRGYNSESEMWGAAMRLQRHADNGQRPVILHFSDHDPSGLDMTNDIETRMNTFGVSFADIDRVALTIKQVRHYKLPPNPARKTDARYRAYRAQYGDKSWELDALEPSVLANTVKAAVLEYRDEKQWAKAEKRERKERKEINKVAIAPWRKVVMATK